MSLFPFITDINRFFEIPIPPLPHPSPPFIKFKKNLWPPLLFILTHLFISHLRVLKWCWKNCFSWRDCLPFNFLTVLIENDGWFRISLQCSCIFLTFSVSRLNAISWEFTNTPRNSKVDVGFSTDLGTLKRNPRFCVAGILVYSGLPKVPPLRPLLKAYRL